MTTFKQMTQRTTVSFDDEIYKTLEKWAKLEIRPVASLIAAIVISCLQKKLYPVPEAVLEPLSQASDESAITPKELELTRRWVAGDRLENGELGIVANVLGVEPEDLVKKQRKFAPKKREENPC